MIRKYQFEADIYETYYCLPMGTRRKLDRVGLKIGLEQWQSLTNSERLAICHLPIDSAEEREVLDAFVRELVKRHSGVEPKPLTAEQRAIAEPAATPPATLIENARAVGVTLGQSDWDALEAEERYALTKLGTANPPGHNFPAALSELVKAKRG